MNQGVHWIFPPSQDALWPRWPRISTGDPHSILGTKPPFWGEAMWHCCSLDKKRWSGQSHSIQISVFWVSASGVAGCTRAYPKTTVAGNGSSRTSPEIETVFASGIKEFRISLEKPHPWYGYAPGGYTAISSMILLSKKNVIPIWFHLQLSGGFKGFEKYETNSNIQTRLRVWDLRNHRHHHLNYS